MSTMESSNIILLADSYKFSHHLQYPPGTTDVYSYFESRGGRFPYTVFFGLQYILKKYLLGQVVTKEKITEAKDFALAHFRGTSFFNEEGWTYILEKHNGYLPLRICAVPEGSVIPTRNVLFTVENTDPKVPWITSFVETLMVQTWYPLTVATISRIQKQIINSHLEETSDNFDSLNLMLHDFGFRGSSSVESAGIGGGAHLVNFQGSDNLAAIYFLRNFYHCPMAGFSIPAAEHSTITTWGQDDELDAYINLLDKFPSGPLSIVNDSYDVFKSCEEYVGKVLKQRIIDHGKRGGIVVLRPDSGDPTTVLLRLFEILEKYFEVKKNGKGYKMLPPYLRIIQGDGVNYRAIDKILTSMKEAGWSAANISFGSGGALLQKINRDTQKCAFKCSHCIINGRSVEVFKDPVTDSGKKSKRGRLSLHCENGVYVTKEHGEGGSSKDLLEPVFENGKLLRDQTLDDIRSRARLTSNDIDIKDFLTKDVS